MKKLIHWLLMLSMLSFLLPAGAAEEELKFVVRNGSILLFHTRKKDYDCMQAIIPRLLEEGFQMVTVSDLLGFGPNEISEELYVYRKEDYQGR